MIPATVNVNATNGDMSPVCPFICVGNVLKECGSMWRLERGALVEGGWSPYCGEAVRLWPLYKHHSVLTSLTGRHAHTSGRQSLPFQVQFVEECLSKLIGADHDSTCWCYFDDPWHEPFRKHQRFQSLAVILNLVVS